MLHPIEPSTKQIKHFKYCPGDMIGKGFSSQVYRGTNLQSNQAVALKVIDLKSINTEVQKLLLGNELKALRQLKHENVIETYDICQTQNNIYIVTEFCNQGDLTSQIKARGRFKEEEAIRVFRQIVNGLGVIAANGVIHRDLKTANILIKDGVAKIADFGFCDFVREPKGKHLTYNVGSPLYMSPEAYRRSSYSHKSDIWAAGIILYQMLLGDQPFKGIDYETLLRTIASGQIYNTINVSGFTKMLLSRLLAIQTQRRIDINELTLLLNQNSQPKIISERILQPSMTQSTQVISKHTATAGNLVNAVVQRVGLMDTTKNFLNRPISLMDLSQKVQGDGKPMTGLRISEAIMNRSIDENDRFSQQGFGSISIDLGQMNNNQIVVPNFQKKKTVLTHLATEPTIITIQAKSPTNAFKPPPIQIVRSPIDTLQCSKQNNPIQVSFESHLSIYSATHPQFSSASEKLLISKFLYRLCKLLSEEKAANQHYRRLFILALRHLEATLRFFEKENYFYISESTEQNSFKKLNAKTKEFASQVKPSEFATDEYFTFVLQDTRNFNTQAVVRYTQFWVKQTLKDLCEAIQSYTSNLSSNFENYDIQHQSVSYLYCLKYYEILEALKGKPMNEDIPNCLGLSKLMSESPTINPDNFITLCQSAKCLVK